MRWSETRRSNQSSRDKRWGNERWGSERGRSKRWAAKSQLPVLLWHLLVFPRKNHTTNQQSDRTAQFLFLLAAAAFITGGFLVAAPAAEEKHISVYSPVATYTLPVVDRGGQEYVGLLELLEPLGRVSTVLNGRSLRLRYNSIDAEFVAGRSRGKIRGREFDFTAPFLIENSRGMVPFNSLSTMLPRFLGTPVNFHDTARRLFIGEVTIQASFRLESSTPPRLVLTFTAPVNPTISSEPGALRMVFKHDPVVSPGSSSISFDNKVITHASYSEGDGIAQLDVTANQPLMASFSSDRRTITIAAIEPATAVTSPSTPQPGAQPPAQPATAPAAGVAPVGAPAAAGVHRPLAVVDPAHGGAERGAALSDTLTEKEVTLGWARLLRHELEQRGFAVALLRESDTTATLDQRAAAANGARAGIYISLHAVSQGSGARVYTALLPVESASKGVFHSWNAAQAPVLPVSRLVSAAIVSEFRRRDFPIASSSASLRPLNNIFMPAVAVELAPGANGLSDLVSANYQQRAAAAVADAIVSVRDRLGAQP